MLGNEQLGSLISRLQSTVISNGNELERLLLERCKQVQDVDFFIFQTTNNKTENGAYVCTKKIFKKSTTYCTSDISGIEPDLIIFIVSNSKVCKIVELKDGDAFDTKKSQGEYENLSNFALHFGAKIPFITDFYICSFNQENKEVIYNGFKKKFDYVHILTGRELCEILDVNYDEIRSIRERDAKANFQYFIDEMLKIEEVKQYIQTHIGE